MSRNEKTSVLIDELLKFTILSGAVGVGLFIPNAMIAIEKPLNKYLDGLDKKARERELRRLVGYMKSRCLITESYEHGITVTNQGKKRLKEVKYNQLRIPSQVKWDNKWRLVFYDIPETNAHSRRVLQQKLQDIGFLQLQRSVLIHSFPCLDTIEAITDHHGISKYVTCVEVTQINNQNLLINKFKAKYPQTIFK